MKSFIAACLMLVSAGWSACVAGQTSSAGSVAEGARVFRACAACHSVEPGRNLAGPSLAGVIGRKAGSAAGFLRYSAALKNSGIIWSAKNIDAWLANPAAFIPGNAMAFRGLPDPNARSDVIAFLAAASSGKAAEQIERLPQSPRLTEAPASHKVTALRHCRDSYFVSTADGRTRGFWEFDLRFKTDTSDRGPGKKQPVMVGQGMGGDRAQIVFADPAEISPFIAERCE